ncbi:heavy metal translocating P-type ATPase [Bifidobacterium aesculapii]|uniref:heavy metal translocating P-type ATPase n=1 Tax=Bifidobacterium aesculapii TaxID=1329411 RepID=UPI0006E36308|nr:heavy metal translocating P-type ATPase [Bifidobacterium aesculapii]
MLPVVVLSAIPIALLWSARPWGASPWAHALGEATGGAITLDPSIGQWVAVALVAYTVVVTVIGMVDDIRHGHVGVDLLAVLAMLSTIAVGEYWAAWAVVLMVTSGEAIEEFAQSKAEHSLTALLDAAPRTAHVANLPGVGRAGAHSRAARNIAPIRGDDGFRHVAAFRAVAPGDATARDGVCALTGRDPETCDTVVAQADRRVRPAADARFETVPVDEVRLGDVVIVLPGETVPVDGELLSGSATLDLSAINGEPLPREVFAGARVMSGAVNGSGTLAMRVTQVAADSQYQRILALVRDAQDSRPAVVKTADRLAVPFTVLALLIAGVAWAVAGTPLRFAQVLVLATPCPLLIAAPVAYIAGTSRLASSGVLIKTQDMIEQLGRVTQVFFDKTGTLTVKQPQVVRVELLDAGSRSPRIDEDHVLMFAGVVESYSMHVLANGIAAAGREAIGRLHARYAAGRRECPEPEASRPGHGRDYPVVKDVKETSGSGIAAEVDGHVVRVGRLAFAAAGDNGFLPTGSGAGFDPVFGSGLAQSATHAASDPSAASADTQAGPRRTRFRALAADEMASYVSVDGRLVGRIVLRDVPRANARAALARLRALGVARLAMLTGDKRASAEIVAREVGVDEVHAELFPEDKLAVVRAAGASAGSAAGERNGGARGAFDSSDGRRGSRGGVTMMVGDGVNDAPVLAAAGIGVAMTDGVSTAASESAQVVIMNDDIAAVPRAIAIARRTKRVMLQAVVAGLALAVVGMIAAAFDLIPVVVGAFLQEGIDVVSILWALTAVLDRE